MKKHEIVVGGKYIAKVAGKLTTVRVDAIRDVLAYGGDRSGLLYDVTNLTTNRKTTFRSAAKFRREVGTGSAGPKATVVPVGNPNRPGFQVLQVNQDADERMSLLSTNNGQQIPAESYTLDEDGNEVEEVEHRSDPTERSATTPSKLLHDSGVHASSAVASITSSPPMPPPASAPPSAPSGGTPTTPTSGLAARLAAQMSTTTDDSPHLIVEARAGTGKTTTLIEGLKRLLGVATAITPSPQQQQVWDELCRSAGKVRTIGFVAFSRPIAGELKNRVPNGVEAMTMHSLGFAAVRRAFSKRMEVTTWRVQDIIGDVLGKDIREVKKKNIVLVNAVEQLVSLCKMNLSHRDPCGNDLKVGDPDWTEVLDDLAAYYDVDCNGCRNRVYDLVPRVLERCMDPQRDGRIDYDDMIWLPIALNLPIQPYDMLLVDEAQDLNRCQQALAKRAGKRLVFVGDDRQAIYGFCGADAQSLRRLKDELTATDRKCVSVPLTVTRRCGKAIVHEAQRYVPDFEAYETNGEGSVTQAQYRATSTPLFPDLPNRSYHEVVKDGDMVLCRTNAPLVSQCFKFLRAGRKAQIQGRDIGKGLVSTINKLKAASVADLIAKLSDWRSSECKKESAKKNPSESRISGIQDRYDCLVCFTEGIDAAALPDAVVKKIEAVFTDDKDTPGIRLSSIHKAKGLEAHRVFWLRIKEAQMREDKMQPWERDQENNLRYVAITRAITELVYVS